MSYQVLARKWRPQRFDDVVGQRAVTQTLRNAIKTGRIAHAFVFAGPRGVGKTTTARILARALNCVEGPTPDPCGRCDACIEIAEGRDMDVLEIDAATHTQVDNVRSIIVEGLSFPPVRDRFKLFIIDEVHQLSSHSFNALLKSIEEPPPHAAFVMATTELVKIPETILSRSQVFEFKTISSHAITEQLRRIADAEKIAVDDEALALVARAADGSMRDAETALDQVLAFASDRITVDDVSSVLGLVGRDLLLDALQAVVDEDGAAAFALAGRAVEAGYDLKLVCRELSRVVRDLMVLSIDPARISDPDVAPEGERERLQALSSRFSREDLLRAFDVLTRAEADIRNAAEPRYHLEMALMRWIHLRKLAPLAQLIERLQADPGALRAGPSTPGRGSVTGPGRTTAPTAGGPGRPIGGQRTTSGAPPASSVPPRTDEGGDTARESTSSIGESRVGRTSRTTDPPSARNVTSPVSTAGPGRRPPHPLADVQSPRASQAPATSPGAVGSDAQPATSSADTTAGLPGSQIREAFLSGIQQARAVFYRTVVAQAQSIEMTGDAIVFSFAPVHRLLKEQVEQNRAWLQSLAEGAAGRPVSVQSVLVTAATTTATAPGAQKQAPRRTERDLRAAVLKDEGVQALLGVFPAEIRVVEEIERRKP